jgi:hypothetical protein
VTAIPKKEPDIRLYVLALLALARQLQATEEKEANMSKDNARARDREASHD